MPSDSDCVGQGDDTGLDFGTAARDETAPAYLGAHFDRPQSSVVNGVGLGTRSSLKASFISGDRGEFSPAGDPQYLSLVQHLGGARVWRKGNARPVEVGEIGMEPFEGATYFYDGSVQTSGIYIPFGLLGMVSHGLLDREFTHDAVEIPLGLRDAELSRVMDVIRTGIVAHAPTNLVLDSWALILADTVVRRFSLYSARVRDTRLGKFTVARTAHVVAYVEAHLDQDLRLEALAAVADCSPFHFARRFKETIGVSPHAYVLARRIGRAEAMLRRANIGLAELSAACGFSSQAHLTTAFRHRLGTTPHAYRQALAS